MQDPFIGVRSAFPGFHPVCRYTMFFMFVGEMAERFHEGDPRPRALCPPEARPRRRWQGYA